MPWNNQYNNGYGGQGYRRPYYSNGYRPNNSYSQSRPQTKKSGAKLGHSRKTDKPVITAWKKTRTSFLVMVATPNNGANIAAKGGRVITNAKGQEYARWTATLTEKRTGTKTTHSALYNTVTKKLYLTDLKMVASPQAPNGGFFGNSFVSKNTRRY